MTLLPAIYGCLLKDVIAFVAITFVGIYLANTQNLLTNYLLAAGLNLNISK